MPAIDSSTINRKLLTRLFSKIKLSTEHSYKGVPCWEWQAQRDKDGYGVSSCSGKVLRAHRLMYELFVGSIPSTLVSDHLCNVPFCVNPVHINLVSQKENVHRSRGICAVNHRKTHCISGHPFDVGNTYIAKDGQRMCRKCSTSRMRTRRRKAGCREKASEFCLHGHRFDFANTYVTKEGWRQCKTCKLTHKREARRRPR